MLTALPPRARLTPRDDFLESQVSETEKRTARDSTRSAKVVRNKSGWRESNKVNLKIGCKDGSQPRS
jgi:hypothetical protein